MHVRGVAYNAYNVSITIIVPSLFYVLRDCRHSPSSTFDSYLRLKVFCKEEFRIQSLHDSRNNFTRWPTRGGYSTITLYRHSLGGATYAANSVKVANLQQCSA